MLEKLTPAKMGDDIGFVMGYCVYKQYYKDLNSTDPTKKDVRHVNWHIGYFDEANQLIKSNLSFTLSRDGVKLSMVSFFHSRSASKRCERQS